MEGSQEPEQGFYSQRGPRHSDSELLKNAVLNEKSAPEILQYEDDLIDRIESHIEYQESQIEIMADKPDLEILRTLFSTELSRVRFLLRSYLRTRLLKIERYTMHILDNEDVSQRLSQKEIGYAQEFFTLWAGHMTNTVAGHLPEAFSSLVKQASAHREKDMVQHPDLNTHIFCKVLIDQGAIPVDDEGNTAEFSKDDVFVVRYKPVQSLVHSGAVQLV